MLKNYIAAKLRQNSGYIPFLNQIFPYNHLLQVYIIYKKKERDINKIIDTFKSKW